MGVLKLGLSLAALFFGGLAAFVGLAVTVLALKSGEINVSVMGSSGLVEHVSNRITDPSRFWLDLTLFGVGPLVVGTVFALLGWRNLKSD